MAMEKQAQEEARPVSEKVDDGNPEDASRKMKKKGVSPFAKVGIVLAIFLIIVGIASIWYYSANPEQGSAETEQQNAAEQKEDQADAPGSVDEGESASTASSSSSSSSSSKPSSSYKLYDDDRDYSYGSESSSGSSSDRRQTYAHTDPDGWSYMEYNDGSAEITDGWGMVARDTDGDGDLDKISTDSGETWEDFE